MFLCPKSYDLGKLLPKRVDGWQVSGNPGGFEQVHLWRYELTQKPTSQAFRDYFRVAGYSTGTENSILNGSMSASAITH
jgi:hypothetical protein